MDNPLSDRERVLALQKCRLAGHEAVGHHEDESRQMASIFAKIIVNKNANMKRTTRP